MIIYRKPYIFLALISLFFSACSGITGNTGSKAGLGGTHFYSLSALKSSSTQNQSSLKIGVGPIEIPRLLNRPQIITRKNDTEIIMAELNQWGGSFKEDLMQAIIDNLSILQKTDNIEHYPWKFSFKPKYQVRIHIERLDGELGKNVLLKARWRLLKNNQEILVKRTIINAPITEGDSYNSYVRSLSKALILLSKEISSNIK